MRYPTQFDDVVLAMPHRERGKKTLPELLEDGCNYCLHNEGDGRCSASRCIQSTDFFDIPADIYFEEDSALAEKCLMTDGCLV